MRDYQPKGKYWLDRRLYRRTLATIRDYNRMIEDVANFITRSPNHDTNGGRSSLPSNPTENIAIRIASMQREIRIIEDSLSVIPEDYQEGVWLNVTQDRKYPIESSKSTYSKYKQKYIYEVAVRMGWAYKED